MPGDFFEEKRIGAMETMQRDGEKKRVVE